MSNPVRYVAIVACMAVGFVLGFVVCFIAYRQSSVSEAPITTEILLPAPRVSEAPGGTFGDPSQTRTSQAPAPGAFRTAESVAVPVAESISVPLAPTSRSAPEAFQEEVDVLMGEAVDRPWAARNTRVLEGQFQAMQEAGNFRLLHVDCRSTSCLAELQWNSYSDAIQNFRAVMSRNFQLEGECIHGMSLTPPTDPTAAYEGRMIFRCGNVN